MDLIYSEFKSGINGGHYGDFIAEIGDEIGKRLKGMRVIDEEVRTKADIIAFIQALQNLQQDMLDELLGEHHQ